MSLADRSWIWRKWWRILRRISLNMLAKSTAPRAK